MNFNELLSLAGASNPPKIRTDSRLVGNGDIFVAVQGNAYDGHDFIDKAVANGAKYIVAQNHKTSIEHQKSRVEEIIVEDSAAAAAQLAQAIAGKPASQLTNLAVTGTNGKTTVAFLVRSCIQQAGEKCGLIGTIIYDSCSGSDCQAPLTTPDCLTIADQQRQMVKNGAKYMVIEASSHALTQNRLAGIHFKAAAFTNLTSDHMDYHKTRLDYLAAKTLLFSALSTDAVAILNKQSPEAKSIAVKTKAKILWYAVDEPADITARIESMDIDGTTFTLQYAKESSIVHTPLLGLHNVSNHLAAAGLCLAAGLNLETIAAGLSNLRAIPGRLERIDWNGPFTVLVDFAHTEDALKNVLTTLRPLCRGKLRVVFGCGGDRDRTKRPRMARVVEQLADFIIVTSDNPRTERPEDIIAEIAAGFEKGPAIPRSQLRATSDELRATKIIEPDRHKAIELAIKTACCGDIVLIAGKGHESYQIIGTQKIPFSDKEIAQDYLKKYSAEKCFFS
jgi:UDP-N-acetylmuramoyl-L-alanyl-D-glutamate--2,6-diaminopimelate ligase